MGQAVSRSRLEVIRRANAKLTASQILDRLADESDEVGWLFYIEECRGKKPIELHAALDLLAHDETLPPDVACFARFCLDQFRA